MSTIGIQVPYCTGRNKPSHEIPAGACDCHHHIYDPVRFPYRPEDVRNQPPADVACYRLLQKKLGSLLQASAEEARYYKERHCSAFGVRAG